MALLSTNPFLNAPKTSGTTTPSFSPTQGNPTYIQTGSGNPTVPTATGFSSSSTGQPIATTTASSMGATAKSPMLNLQPQSNTLPSGQTNTYQSNLQKYGLSSIPAGYSFDASGKLTNNSGQEYASPSKNIPDVNTTGTSQGLGTGGGAAPAGMSYNAQGQLVPTTSLPSGTPPQTFNTNPYNAAAPTYPGLIGALAGTASQPSAGFIQAQQTAQKALQDLETSRQNEADALSLNSQNPIPLEFQQGRGQIIQNQYLQQQNALAQEYAGATAQQQAATGQQGVQQQGLGQAAGFTAPQQVSPTNVPFNPATGQYGAPAATAFGGGNGLQGVGAIAGQIGVGQQVTQLNSYLGGAQVVGNNLNSLISSAHINPSSLTYANGAFQFGANLMSNPQYREFAGQINDFVASLAPILGVGGNVTDMKTQMSNQIVNGLQSGQTIQQVVNYFLAQAQQKIQGLSTGGGAGVGSAPTGNSGGMTFGGFFGK